MKKYEVKFNTQSCFKNNTQAMFKSKEHMSKR